MKPNFNDKKNLFWCLVDFLEALQVSFCVFERHLKNRIASLNSLQEILSLYHRVVLNPVWFRD